MVDKPLPEKRAFKRIVEPAGEEKSKPLYDVY